MLGLSNSLSLGAMGAGFSPAALFAGGGLGATFDPSDLTTLFQDVGGTIPVTTPGQTVARMLDRSGNGAHATQADAAKRPVFAREPRVGRRNMMPNSGSAGAVLGVIGSGGALPTGWSMGGSLTREVVAIGQTNGITHCDVRLTGTLTGGYFMNLSENAGVPAAAGQTWNASVYAQAVGSVVGASALIVVPASFLAGGSNKFAYTGSTIGFPGELTQFVTPATTLLDADGVAGGVAFILVYLRLNCTGTVDVTLRLGGRQVEQGGVATAFQTVNGSFDVTEAGVASVFYLASDQVDDSLPATVPSLGTNATVWNAGGAGINILTGQTIGAGAFETLRGAKTYGVGAINRALTGAETTNLTAYLEAQRTTP